MTRFSKVSNRRWANTAASLSLTLGLAIPLCDAIAAPLAPLPIPRPASDIRQTASKAADTTGSVTSNSSKQMPLAVIPVPRRQVTADTNTSARSVPSVVAPTASTPQGDIRQLAQAIALAQKDRGPEATQVADSINDPVARKLAEWVILRSNNNRASTERYRAFVTGNPTWPSTAFLKRRAESALWDDRRNDAVVLDYFANEQPSTGKGKLILARAMLARGDRDAAARLVRDAWRNDTMSADVETAALEMFGPLISAGDHKARMDSFLYGKDPEPGMRAARRLGSGHHALARARKAANDRAANAAALIAAVPHQMRNDPGYIFSRVQLLRRDEKFAEAARLLQSLPSKLSAVHNPDEWWIERRLVARKLMDVGDYRNAYIVARDAETPEREVYKTEQQFTAGWIALRFLKDAETAARHFARIGVGSVNPTTLARAGYWQGRAAEAAGRSQDARQAFSRAAHHSTSYYGQLARAKLGMPQLDLAPQPRSGTRNVGRLEVVRAAQLLYAIGEPELTIPIHADVGENGDQDALLGMSELAARNSDARGMLIVGKAALNRGLPFEHYAYPTVGIPNYRPIAPEVERALVFAIARQESSFNPSIVSPANAHGLMQVTPSAGQYIAKRYGVSFDLNRMKNDPVYNTTFGAAELASLQDDYRGSLVMTFAGYNAGRGSVRKWIARYGDPRDPNVDTVDWVEQIPFAETRNYVQRIMENLQVYRTRFGGGNKLQISADMQRGSQR